MGKKTGQPNDILLVGRMIMVFGVKKQWFPLHLSRKFKLIGKIIFKRSKNQIYVSKTLCNFLGGQLSLLGSKHSIQIKPNTNEKLRYVYSSSAYFRGKLKLDTSGKLAQTAGTGYEFFHFPPGGTAFATRKFVCINLPPDRQNTQK